jgi:hypothetical protein
MKATAHGWVILVALPAEEVDACGRHETPGSAQRHFPNPVIQLTHSIAAFVQIPYGTPQGWGGVTGGDPQYNNFPNNMYMRELVNRGSLAVTTTVMP